MSKWKEVTVEVSPLTCFYIELIICIAYEPLYDENS